MYMAFNILLLYVISIQLKKKIDVNNFCILVGMYKHTCTELNIVLNGVNALLMSVGISVLAEINDHLRTLLLLWQRLPVQFML